MISYLQLVQTFVQNSSYYPPETVLQGIYGTRYYSMLEHELAAEGDVEDLIDLTAKALNRLIPFVQNFCPPKVTVSYDITKYDPTIRFYYNAGAEPDLIGFLDLPCYIFYYTPSEQEAQCKQNIKQIQDKMKNLVEQRDQLIEEYDYTKQTGAVKLLMRMSRKENYEEAQRKISYYDKRLLKQHTKLEQEKELLQQIQEAAYNRIEPINSLEESFAKYGITASEIMLNSKDTEEEKEESADAND